MCPISSAGPGKVPTGRKSDAVITTMDLLPTFASLAAVTLPGNLKIDGRDVSAVITGESSRSPHDYYFYYCYTHLHGVRDDRFKLVLPRAGKPEWMKWRGRFIDEVKEVELYDLKNDAGEEKNIAKEHPKIVDRLMMQIERARVEIGDVDRIGSGARFYDKEEKRPEIAKYKKWNSGG